MEEDETDTEGSAVAVVEVEVTEVVEVEVSEIEDGRDGMTGGTTDGGDTTGKVASIGKFITLTTEEEEEEVVAVGDKEVEVEAVIVREEWIFEFKGVEVEVELTVSDVIAATSSSFDILELGAVFKSTKDPSAISTDASGFIVPTTASVGRERGRERGVGVIAATGRDIGKDSPRFESLSVALSSIVSSITSAC